MFASVDGLQGASVLNPSDVMIATISLLESTSELRCCSVASLHVRPREEQWVVHEVTTELALHPERADGTVLKISRSRGNIAVRRIRGSDWPPA